MASLSEKDYLHGQTMLFPADISTLIPSNHLVRIVNKFVDELDLSDLRATYSGGGAQCYHVGMMLKVLLYGYCEKIYSSRQIAKALRENVNFMWLSAFQTPNFRTINRFRCKHAGKELEQIFAGLVESLLDSGHISFENYFIDGTKIEANSNKFKYVWQANSKRHHENVKQKIREILDEVSRIDADEDKLYGDNDLPEVNIGEHITSEMIKERAKKIKLKMPPPPEKPVKKKEKKDPRQGLLKFLEKDLLPRLEKYEEQLRILGDRRSYSKTDPDAIFMRLKEDSLQNGQLKAAYNFQIGTENQFILGFSVHAQSGDTKTLQPHLNKLEKDLGFLPDRIIADAGYGSEENYSYLKKLGLEAVIKYNTYDKQQKKSFKRKVFHIDNFYYDENGDYFQCPAGEKLSKTRDKKERTDAGYVRNLAEYSCDNCNECEMKQQCTKAKGNRILSFSRSGYFLRKEMREKLSSEKGKAIYARRKIEPESVFGNIKQNMGFKRLYLRGLRGAEIELGLISMAHNLRKRCKITKIN